MSDAENTPGKQTGRGFGVDAAGRNLVASPSGTADEIANEPTLNFGYESIPAIAPLDTIPSLGHAVLFFVLLAPLLFAGQYFAIWVAQSLHLFGHKPFYAYVELAAVDARLGLGSQTFTYLLIAVVSAWLFSLLWGRPFTEGLHWRAEVARRRAWWLMLLGLAAGFGTSLIGDFLPMPKDAPIVVDMMRSPVGAWCMLAFGVTLAPALEEMAFRGFLLPGFVHAFGWLVRKGDLSAQAGRWLGLPVSILLTSLPFAFMHSTQVSHAWAPILLIGIVSAVLCVVRIALDSLAASTLVHAAYNFTLFAGILVQTDGFRHLERLKG